jgi:hypothetical protein
MKRLLRRLAVRSIAGLDLRPLFINFHRLHIPLRLPTAGGIVQPNVPAVLGCASLCTITRPPFLFQEDWFES